MLYLINSKISGMSRSRCFILSFIAVMMELALSSAPCLEDFSAAPAKHTAQAMPTSSWQLRDAPGAGPPPRAHNHYPTTLNHNLTRVQLKIQQTSSGKLTLCQIWSGRWPRAAQAGVDLSAAPVNQIQYIPSHFINKFLFLADYQIQQAAKSLARHNVHQTIN